MRVRRVGKEGGRGRGARRASASAQQFPGRPGGAAVGGVPSHRGAVLETSPRSASGAQAGQHASATPRRGPRGAAGRCAGRERRLGGGHGDRQGPDAGAEGQPGNAFSSPGPRGPPAPCGCARCKPSSGSGRTERGPGLEELTRGPPRRSLSYVEGWAGRPPRAALRHRCSRGLRAQLRVSRGRRGWGVCERCPPERVEEEGLEGGTRRGA